MGEHIDNRGPRRKKTNESEDILARKRRVTFKNYIRELEEELLEVEAEGEDDLPTQLEPFGGWPTDLTDEEIDQLIKERGGKFSTDESE